MGFIIVIAMLLLILFYSWWPLKKCCDWFSTGRGGYGWSLIALILGMIFSWIGSAVLGYAVAIAGVAGLLQKIIIIIASIIITVKVYSSLLDTTVKKALILYFLSAIITMGLYLLTAIILVATVFIGGIDYNKYVNKIPMLAQHETGIIKQQEKVQYKPENPKKISHEAIMPEPDEMTLQNRVNRSDKTVEVAVVSHADPTARVDPGAEYADISLGTIPSHINETIQLATVSGDMAEGILLHANDWDVVIRINRDGKEIIRYIPISSITGVKIVRDLNTSANIAPKIPTAVYDLEENINIINTSAEDNSSMDDDGGDLSSEDIF